LKLNKSLYGLKQASREWFYIVHNFFESIGLKSTDTDPNLFINNRIYILLFVDNMLVAEERQHIDVAKAKIIKEWKCKNLGPAEVFVGFQIDRDRTNQTLKLHQTMYTNKLLKRLKINNYNLIRLPIPAGTVLQPNTKDPLDHNKATVYRQVIGLTIYLANCTRPDIS
jgi:hypothetical protein